MTTTDAPARDPVSLVPRLSSDHMTQLNLSLALLMAASFVVFVPAMLIDPRALDSAPVWVKPQKFNISLALHFFTITALAQLVPRKVRTGPTLIVFSYLAGFALLLEYVWVAVQAAQAKRSHFNYDSQFEGLMYAAMGVGAFLLMTIAMALAVQIWRKGDRSRFGLWLGSVVGLTGAFFSTLYFGFEMSSSSRYVGAPLEGGGATVPFFGWSREYGDLRPAHFVSLHLMQTVPFAGWLADRREWNAKGIVAGVTLAQLGLAAALFLQAKAGQPFWPA
ncbi:MAG: hypothetical protein QNI87_10925 [Erythrobacter sp.]|uniref:hypothetical protein n=1 Tax=Erythrobacter sp. TaxID=1042 RepID=UPI00261D9E8E|nr:hypothetical protein [Erythrobacter sp.]MDJ0979033.1 hypothetical protein [Erythrobacter sp.]